MNYTKAACGHDVVAVGAEGSNARKKVGCNPCPNCFECDECGGIFAKGQDDDEAAKEFDKNFPGETMKDCAIVCDDCYAAILKCKGQP